MLIICIVYLSLFIIGETSYYFYTDYKIEQKYGNTMDATFAKIDRNLDLVFINFGLIIFNLIVAGVFQIKTLRVWKSNRT